MAISRPKQSDQTLTTFFKSVTFPQTIIHCFQILLAACLMGICAQIKIPLPFTPIPLTMQTVGVMLIGATLGSRKGAYAILCYLIQGCMGLPVWAGGNASGFMHIIGPTGGYLMAYILQAAFVGWILTKQKNLSFIKIASTLLFSICCQLGIGSLWLAQFVGIEKCLSYGFYPFILIECVKSIFIAIFISKYLPRLDE